MVELVQLARMGIPWSVALGINLVRMVDGFGRVELPWRTDLAAFDDDGGIATGAIAALIDHGCGMAVLSALGEPARISTLNLKVDHLRRSQVGQALTAEAHCFSCYPGMAFVRADVWENDQGDPVAAAQAVFAISRIATVE